MSLAKVEKKLKNHDGTCPVCREHTWVENERTRWLGEGEIQLQIICRCGFEFYATCRVKDVDCEMMEQIAESMSEE